nr:MAG TPA: hypothetical protein [Caudoviricetes sp.]
MFRVPTKKVGFRSSSRPKDKAKPTAQPHRIDKSIISSFWGI